MNSPTGSPLATQGFWGAVITKGGSRENGDQFDPANDFLKSQPNPDFDGKGVDYNVVIAGPNGQLQLYDPTFCATGLRSAATLLRYGRPLDRRPGQSGLHDVHDVGPARHPVRHHRRHPDRDLR